MDRGQESREKVFISDTGAAESFTQYHHGLVRKQGEWFWWFETGEGWKKGVWWQRKYVLDGEGRVWVYNEKEKVFENVEVDSNRIDQIRQIIAAKHWYVKPFNIDKSAANLAKSLSSIGIKLSQEQIRELLELAFGFGAVEVEGKEGEKISLAFYLTHHGYNWVVWTVGDANWQKIKIRQSGVDQCVSNNRCWIFNEREGEDKVEGLAKKVGQINEVRKIIVVDDKRGNLDAAEKVLRDNFPNIEVVDFHFKIGDKQADANRFIAWLQEQIQDSEKDRVLIITDFDNVLVDTNGVLFNVLTGWIGGVS